jgi:hypothetical protein
MDGKCLRVFFYRQQVHTHTVLYIKKEGICLGDYGQNFNFL